MKRLKRLMVFIAFAALPACGGDETSGNGTIPQKPELLTAGERSDVRDAQVEIRSYCRELTLYLARRRGPPTDQETRRAYAAVDLLAGIAREKPAAAQPLSGRTVRELLGDLAEDLEGANCAPNVGQRIDQALAGLPAQ